MLKAHQDFLISGLTKSELKTALGCVLKMSKKQIVGYMESAEGLLLCDNILTGVTPFEKAPTVLELTELVNGYLDGLSDVSKRDLSGDKPDIPNREVEIGWVLYHPRTYGTYDIRDNGSVALYVVRPEWMLV